jgi:hypothetical protein
MDPTHQYMDPTHQYMDPTHLHTKYMDPTHQKLVVVRICKLSTPNEGFQARSLATDSSVGRHSEKRLSDSLNSNKMHLATWGVVPFCGTQKSKLFERIGKESSICHPLHHCLHLSIKFESRQFLSKNVFLVSWKLSGASQSIIPC